MKKKICIFTISFAYNRQNLINYLESILPSSVEIFVFSPKNVYPKFKTTRSKIIHTNCNKYNSFFELRKFLEKEKIDRVINLGTLPQEGFIMFFATIFKKRDFVCHLVVNPFTQVIVRFDKQSIKAFFELIFLFPLTILSKKFYPASEDITNLSKKIFFLARKKIKNLIYPINTEIFVPKNKVKSRKKLNLEINQKICVTVGRIEYAKGSDIIYKLALKNKDILFILIGELLDKKIKKCSLQNIKIFKPKNQRELVTYYNAADIGLFPSRSEAGPVVAKEAMSCSTPALVLDIMGPRMLKPAIKVKPNFFSINKKLVEFFQKSEKDIKKLKKLSREFVIKESSNEYCQNLYKEFLLK